MDVLTKSFIESSMADFASNQINTLAMNCMTTQDPNKVLQSREHQRENHSHNYSIKVKNEGKATSQKSSGRCWIFACCNVLRNKLIKEYSLADDFELSQTFVFFYDKFERVNYFLEQIIGTKTEELDGRLVQHLLSNPKNDGGQWEMLVNVIRKYGICPKSVYDDAWSSTSSLRFNRYMTTKLREWACLLRKSAESGKSVEDLREMKQDFLVQAHRILMIHFGSPPEKFSWTYHNTKKDENSFHRMDNLTPLEFLEKCCNGFDIDGMVSLIHDPRNEYYKTYTVEALGNVVGERGSFYLNVPIEVLKEYAMKTLRDDKEPVWFGCDVGKSFNRDKQVMDDKQFDYELVFGAGANPSQNKEDRLRYGQSLMTHAMVFTGCDLPEGAKFPTKWRVENSWGSETGDKGYALMTDTWFDEYMYQVVVRASFFDNDDRIKKALAGEPVILPAWDPMGALADEPVVDCFGR